eukprot:14143800-Ditylum_brightwellii.AAC.1
MLHIQYKCQCSIREQESTVSQNKLVSPPETHVDCSTYLFKHRPFQDMANPCLNIYHLKLPPHLLHLQSTMVKTT